LNIHGVVAVPEGYSFFPIYGNCPKKSTHVACDTHIYSFLIDSGFEFGSIAAIDASYNDKSNSFRGCVVIFSHRKTRLLVTTILAPFAFSNIACSRSILDELRPQEMKEFYLVEENNIDGVLNTAKFVPLSVSWRNYHHTLSQWRLKKISLPDADVIKSNLLKFKPCFLGIYWYGGGKGGSRGSIAKMLLVKYSDDTYRVIGLGRKPSGTGSGAAILRRLKYLVREDLATYSGCWEADSLIDEYRNYNTIEESSIPFNPASINNN
jgi:hypothetical protein